jgi:hypothetical protein
MPDRQERIMTRTYEPRLELRLAASTDTATVARLSALDEQRELDGAVLLALLDDTAVAALSLHDGRAVADPFVLTQEIVALLRLRAEHLSAATAARPRRLRRLRRLALAA